MNLLSTQQLRPIKVKQTADSDHRADAHPAGSECCGPLAPLSWPDTNHLFMVWRWPRTKLSGRIVAGSRPSGLHKRVAINRNGNRAVAAAGESCLGACGRLMLIIIISSIMKYREIALTFDKTPRRRPSLACLLEKAAPVVGQSDHRGRLCSHDR